MWEERKQISVCVCVLAYFTGGETSEPSERVLVFYIECPNPDKYSQA